MVNKRMDSHKVCLLARICTEDFIYYYLVLLRKSHFDAINYANGMSPRDKTQMTMPLQVLIGKRIILCHHKGCKYCGKQLQPRIYRTIYLFFLVSDSSTMHIPSRVFPERKMLLNRNMHTPNISHKLRDNVMQVFQFRYKKIQFCYFSYNIHVCRKKPTLATNNLNLKALYMYVNNQTLDPYLLFLDTN